MGFNVILVTGAVRVAHVQKTQRGEPRADLRHARLPLASRAGCSVWTRDLILHK